MAGYSGTPLAKKLGIRAGARLRRVNPPPGLEDWLAPLPEGVRIVSGKGGEADVILYFTTSRAELKHMFAGLAEALHSAGGLWVCWPKQASGMLTNLNGNIVREVGLAGGLVDNKVCAVSEVWSGLRFVRRVKDRPETGGRKTRA